MNQDVTDYFQKQQPWQAEVCESLRNMVHEVVPDVEERLQYGKPHSLKDSHYAAVIHAGKNKVSFMIFNASDLDEIKGTLRSMGNGDRKTVDITEGQTVDYDQLAEFIKQTTRSL